MKKNVYVKPKAIAISAIEETGLLTTMSHTDKISGKLCPDNEEEVDFKWGGNGSDNDKEKDDNGDFWGD